jgi:hypothetical protein
LVFSSICKECTCPYGGGCVGYDNKCSSEQVYSQSGTLRACITGLSVTYKQ